MVSRTKAKGRTARRAPPAKPAAAPVAVAAETPPVEAPAEPAADAPETAPVTPEEIDATASEPAAEHEDAPEASTDTAEAPESADEAPAADTTETIVEGFINGDTLIPIAHPDGGTIDGVETDADGNFLVRAIDAPIYFAHGFAVVDEQA